MKFGIKYSVEKINSSIEHSLEFNKGLFIEFPMNNFYPRFSFL